MAPPTPAITSVVEQLPTGRRGRGGVRCFPLSVVALEAAVGDDLERVAIRESLAFGKRCIRICVSRWSQSVVSQRVTAARVTADRRRLEVD